MIDLVDLHSHDLPGVDDGPKSMGEAAEQVRRLGALGYRVLVTTPHVIQGRYENRRTGIESAVAALQACKRLLADGLVHVAAGDVHGPGDVDLHVRPGLEQLAREVGEERANRLCCNNPARLIEVNA